MLTHIFIQVLSSAEANKRYPPLKIPNDYGCVFENDGGILLADKAVKAIQVSLARSFSHCINEPYSLCRLDCHYDHHQPPLG